MKLLVYDIESTDPGLLEYGMGSYLKYNHKDYHFDVLGIAYITHDGQSGYTSDWSFFSQLLREHDSLLHHNGLYDLGGLLVLAKYEGLDFKLGQHIYYDTLLMAKLNNQNFMSYSLDYLSTAFFGTQKKSSLLHDFAWSSGLYATEKTKETNRKCNARPSEAVMEKWCKSHMSLFPLEIMSDYAIEDCKLTLKLFDRLYEKLDYLDLKRYSILQEICCDMKLRGVRIDLERCREVSNEFDSIADNNLILINKILGVDININSTQQLALELDRLGYTVPRTDKGNPSIDAKWLDSQQGDIIDALIEYRQAKKINRDFVKKLIEYQDCIPGQSNDAKYGMLYPTLKLLGATATGRFSSGGGTGSKEVSIHQIPQRNEKFGKPCRSLFVPFEGESWVCGDFSSQESRLQVHFASLLGCSGAKEIKEKWIENPTMDYHTTVAEITNVSRSAAKTINLGLSYGMGQSKLIASLKVSKREGEEILKQYHRMLPFMSQLQKYCSEAIQKNRYIKVLDGRRLVIGKKLPDNPAPEKDGLNKLCQGSAAAQCMDAMIHCYKAGLKMTIIVHDEISISTNNTGLGTELLRDAMENSVKLSVPSVADIHVGDNWLTAKG